jgi:hypothetical protein
MELRHLRKPSPHVGTAQEASLCSQLPDMDLRLPFNLIWKKDNSSPLLQKFVAQVEAKTRTPRN